jgi:hypothetical protein
MVTIEITAPTQCGLVFSPGDRIITSKLTPELQTLLASVRIDGSHVARLVKASEDDELAIAGEMPETATRGRGRSSR